MCDYSLELVTSRPAKVGDKLISAGFPHTVSRGFASVDEPKVAVCLLPGTELAFMPLPGQKATVLQVPAGAPDKVDIAERHASLVE